MAIPLSPLGSNLGAPLTAIGRSKTTAGRSSAGRRNYQREPRRFVSRTGALPMVPAGRTAFLHELGRYSP